MEHGSAASRHCSTLLSAIDSSAVVMRPSFVRSFVRLIDRRDGACPMHSSHVEYLRVTTGFRGRSGWL